MLLSTADCSFANNTAYAGNEMENRSLALGIPMLCAFVWFVWDQDGVGSRRDGVCMDGVCCVRAQPPRRIESSETSFYDASESNQNRIE